MIMSIFTNLSITYAIQSIRGPFLDKFFIFLNLFDTQAFMFFLIPAIWIGYHKKHGIHIYYLIAVNLWVNAYAKKLFNMPRPYNLDPTVGIIEVGGTGFPSGAAQTSVLLSFLLIRHWKRWWAWAIGINYIFWISLSRIYLGVHFFTDIIGGWILGLILFLLDDKIFPKMYKYFKKLSNFQNLVISQAVPIIAYMLIDTNFILTLAISLSVIGWGIFFLNSLKIELPYPKTFKEWLLRSLIGISGVFALAFIVFKYIPYNEIFLPIILGLWISFFANLVCKKVFSY